MIQQPGMPHIAFEVKAESYADADGHTLYRNKYYVTITPRGGKDQAYKEAEAWLNELKLKAVDRAGFDQNAVMYAQWHERASLMFKMFKEGNELPEFGTPLKTCLAFSPAEVAICAMVKIQTLEDLASANEQAMAAMGIGARTMQMKAIKTLENYQTGKVAEENAALRLRLEQMEEKVQRLEDMGLRVADEDDEEAPVPQAHKGWPKGKPRGKRTASATAEPHAA